jgi:hypothetical protein
MKYNFFLLLAFLTLLFSCKTETCYDCQCQDVNGKKIADGPTICGDSDAEVKQKIEQQYYDPNCNDSTGVMSCKAK